MRGTRSENCLGKITHMHEDVVIFPIKNRKKKDVDNKR